MLREHLPPLEDYITDAESLTAEAFLSRHQWPVLIISEPPSKRTQPRGPTIASAVTETVDFKAALRRPSTAGSEPPRTDSVPPTRATNLICLPLRPKPGASGSKVSIGRSPDADVVLLEESISRFHSGLAWSPDRGLATLSDLGGKNGTYVDGKQLPPGGEADIASGAILRFGSLSARFYTPKGFLAWVSGGAPEKGGAPGPWPRS